MRRIRTRISAETAGRPLLPRRIFQVQNVRTLFGPRNHGIWFYDDKRRPSVPPHAGKPNPEQAVREIQPWTVYRASQNSDLMMQRKALELESSSALERR